MIEQKEKGNMHSIINRKEIYNKYKENTILLKNKKIKKISKDLNYNLFCYIKFQIKIIFYFIGKLLKYYVYK